MSKSFTTRNFYSGKDTRGDDGYRELQVAIFEQAVDDYKAAWRDLKYLRKSFPLITQAQYGAISTDMSRITEIENFADSEWGQTVSPFTEPQTNLFKTGLQWLRVKHGCNGLWDEKGTWHGRIRQTAQKTGKTQKALAKQAGLDANWFGQLLFGEIGWPSMETMMAICKALDISPIWVIFGTDKESYWDWEIRRATQKTEKIGRRKA